MEETRTLVARLQTWLTQQDQVQVAVSGGVDSMTLALLAGRTLATRARMFHAVSPAVPPAASRRVERVAEREGWDLRILEAGEFEDEAYLANPYRRCFHCKSNLYAALAAAGSGTLLSGTNTDDMDDFRPGLEAAKIYRARHPFVECGVSKAGVRRICRHLGYQALSELPASPCLSSRIETGIRIQPEVLRFLDHVETLIRRELPANIVRCRVRSNEIAVQLEEAALPRVVPGEWVPRILRLAAQLNLPTRIRFEPYRMGSAFVPEQ